MGCERIEELLPLYLDHEASDEERRLVEEHLSGCSRCWSTLRSLRRVNLVVATWPEVPEEMRPWLVAIDLKVRHRIRRGRALAPTLFVVRRSLSLAISAAILLIVGAIGFTLLLMGAQVERAHLEAAKASIASASTRAVDPILSQIRGTASSTLPDDQVALQIRRLADVRAITVMDYRKASSRTVSNPSAIKPTLDALATARFVRHDPGLEGRVRPQTYIVQFHLNSGAAIFLLYWPGPSGPNLEDPATKNWWNASGLDTTMLALLPIPAGIATPAPVSVPDRITAANPPTPGLKEPVVRRLPAPVVSLTAGSTNPRTVYALLVSNALFRSDDAGQTWRHLALPATETSYQPSGDQPNAVFLLPQRDVIVPGADPNRVYVVAEHVLYASADGGANWKPLNDAVYAWTIADAAGRVLYAWHGTAPATSSGLYRSTDAGATWQEVFTGVFPPDLASAHCPCSHEGITALVADPRSADVVYAGTDFGVYRSQDGGKTWLELANGMPSSSRLYRWTPILSAAPDGTIYALSEFWPNPANGRGELIRMRPGQSTWSVVGHDSLEKWQDPNALFFGISMLVADPSQTNRLYLGTTHGLLLSDDGGESWQPASTASDGAVYRVAVAAADSTTAADNAPRVYSWTDGGFAVTSSPTPR